MQKWRPHFSAGSVPMLVFMALMAILAALLWSENARADECSVSLNGVSRAAAVEHGMRTTATGYTLDTVKLARRSGGAGPLLSTVEEQLTANMAWFRAMEAIVADPGTPRLAEVQSLYERGSEAHEIQMALARSLRCQLGIVGTPQQRPESIASLRVSHDARVAQVRAEQEAGERSRASSQSFWNAVGAISEALNAVGSSMRGAQQSAPAGPRDNCSWVPGPGGGHCELGHGG